MTKHSDVPPTQPKKAQPRKTRERRVPKGWLGFQERLNQAIAFRMNQWGVSKSRIATMADTDVGNLNKITDPRRDCNNVTAPTVLSLALALNVSQEWLLSGRGESGLEWFDYQTGPGVPPDTSGDQGSGPVGES